MSKPGDPKTFKWESYVVRTCKSMHECVLCDAGIKLGEKYRDGGSYRQRAHESCVQKLKGAPK